MAARIDPTTPQNAPADGKPLLGGLRKALGKVPNLSATIAHSRAALRGLLGLEGALAKGAPSARQAEIDFPRASRLPEA